MSFFSRVVVAVLSAVLAAGGPACSKPGASEASSPAPEAPAAAVASGAASSPGTGTGAGAGDGREARDAKPGTILDVLPSLDACTLGHQGLLFDLGEPVGTRGGDGSGSGVETAEREGATWARFRARTARLPFVALDEARGTEPLYVAAQVRGLAARGASVSLDGKPVGSWSFGGAAGSGTPRVVVARGGAATLSPGSNELQIHFVGGGARQSDEVLAEIDWIHIGRGNPDPTYAAPTRAQAVTSVTLDGVAKRAVSLRAPGFVRCTTFIPAGARVQADVGLVGGGEGTVEVRLHRDRAEPAVISRVHVSAAPGQWIHIDEPVPDLGTDGALATLEIAATTATRAARVVLGEPRLVAVRPPPAAPRAAAARGAVILVLGSTAPHSLALYGGPRPVPALAELAARGAVFDAHRSTAGFASGTLASMLTGLGARSHGVVDADARLPRAVTTLADAARQAGIATAYFTANPGTGKAFGFDRGWDGFVSTSPAEEGSAVRLVDEAATWIAAHKEGRFVVVIHARGAHPPWDITPEELKRAPPSGYVGTIDPRNSGPLLARHRRPPIRLTDADRTRLWALHGAAIDAHDAALGRLVAVLKATDREGDTAIFVTSDVAASETSAAPYAEGDPVDEATLAVPLVVLAPKVVPAGVRVRTPTTSLDLARSVLGALGLEAPVTFGGVDLLALARGEGSALPRPLVAEGADRFIVRWGPFVLVGNGARDHKLCDLSLEPACLTDVQSTYPIALDALRRTAKGTLEAESTAGRTIQPREPATIDSATGAALRVWGR